jgi:hypothetical protein
MPYHLHLELWHSPKRAVSDIARTPQSCTGTPSVVLTAHASLGVSTLHAHVLDAADASRRRFSVPPLPAHSPSQLLRRYWQERRQERRHRYARNTAEGAVAVL